MKKLLLPVLALVLAFSLVLPAATPALADGLAVLWAGNGAIHVGNVTVSNDDSNIYVTYNITLGGWLITETHVAIGETVADIPQTRSGNPKIGHFGYSSQHDPGVKTFTHTIPLDGMTGTVVIATHAVVVYKPGDCILQDETAWAWGCGNKFEFEGKNWATYFTYVVQ